MQHYLCLWHRKESWRKWIRSDNHIPRDQQAEVKQRMNAIANATSLDEMQAAIESLREHRCYQNTRDFQNYCKYWFDRLEVFTNSLICLYIDKKFSHYKYSCIAQHSMLFYPLYIFSPKKIKVITMQYM